jgi:hypothetical protein
LITNHLHILDYTFQKNKKQLQSIKMKKIALFLILIYQLTISFAQDTIPFNDRIKLLWEANSYYAPFGDTKASLPEFIEGRRNNGKYVADNPLLHGATAFGLKIETEIIKNYHIEARFIGEHRGVSYGVLNTASMIVYPLFKVSLVDTIHLGKLKWIVSGTVGQEQNFQQGEGLYLYNLNCHAERFRLQTHPHLIFEVLHIGDLQNGIGLELDEVFQQSVIFSNIPISKITSKRLDIQLSLTQWKHPSRHYFSYFNPKGFVFLPEIILTTYINPSLKVYAHLGLKATNKPYQIDSAIYFKPQNVDNIAAVVGAKWKINTSKMTIETVAEARFYGKSFNFERASQYVFYRPKNSTPFYNNTIGENLYPLSSYDRPFSQWGVFTEYYNKNVGALTLRSKGNVLLKNRFYAYFDTDYNLIVAENETPFHYFFGALGLNYKFRKDIDCGFGLTNKGMNLDVFYPTFYFHTQPTLFVFLKKALN